MQVEKKGYIRLLSLDNEKDKMNERIFHGGVARLRDPQRVALLEVERAVELSLDGVQAAKVLDVGTGSGIFAEAFAGRGLSVAGIDSNPEMVEAARQYVPSGDFRQATAEAIPHPNSAFDLVFFGLVLHETNDAVQALREARRVARRRVAILEWPFRDEPVGPPLAHRFKPEQVLELAAKAGFKRSEMLTLAHLVLFRFES